MSPWGAQLQEVVRHRADCRTRDGGGDQPEYYHEWHGKREKQLSNFSTECQGQEAVDRLYDADGHNLVAIIVIG